MNRYRYSNQKISSNKKEILPVAEKPLSTAQVIAFILFNILLAYLSRLSIFFGTLYGWSTLALGIFFLMQDKKPIRIIYLCGYIVGAELLWRATKAGVFYEYGKYAIIFLLILGILKYRLLKQSVQWPLIYFILLTPSIILLPRFDREAVSFFLSGPLLLAISTIFFSAVQLTAGQVKKLIFMIISPTIGIAFLATYTVLTTNAIVFSENSNFITSGGFGPVQISLQLAFGAVLAFYYANFEKRNPILVLLMWGIAAWLIAQSMFTFSRSGLYNAVGTLFVFLIFFWKKGNQRAKLIMFGIFIFLFIWMIALPYLDQFTGGMLTARFQDTGSTGRDVLAKADWQAFLENPLFGVGPGQALIYHIRFGLMTSSHTEYTRLLAEHGSLGLISLLLLALSVSKRVFDNTSPEGKDFKMLLTAWALLYMLNTTMRTALPGFAFGLGIAIFIFEEKEIHPEEKYSGNRQLLKRQRILSRSKP